MDYVHNILNKKKGGGAGHHPIFLLNDAYSGFTAPVGHTPSQAPQSMQVSGSTTYLSGPSEIADTGQVAAHAPQLTHSSEITCAIGCSSIIIYIAAQPRATLIL